ncbi:hypothetical protein BGP_4015 [Beggiatoa sp. PS]|nr:hypothetical protein BGP_4015 [Beggiatoa sp. PS]
MMIFNMRHPCNRIDKSDGFIIIFEFVSAANFSRGFIQMPVLQLAQESLCFFLRQGCNTAFTGFTTFFR